jgi:hypothetical protein
MNERLAIPPGADLSLSVEGVRTSEAPPENYAFVMNISGLVGAANFTLAPGHNLRHASPEEVSVIREILHRMNGPSIVPVSLPWEYRRTDGGRAEPIPEADWQYFVISFPGTNETLLALEQAFIVAPLELKIGFTVLRHFGGRGLMWHAGRLFQLLDNAWWNLVFLEVTASDAEAISIVHSQFQQHDQRLVDVGRLVRQLLDLSGTPLFAFAILGAFCSARGTAYSSPEADRSLRLYYPAGQEKVSSTRSPKPVRYRLQPVRRSK